MRMRSEYLVTILYVMLAIQLISAVIAGLSTDSFWTFVTGVLGCISTIIVVVTFITILSHLEDILDMIPTEAQKLETRIKQHLSRQNEKTCENCKSGYDRSFAFCPHCGHRDSAPPVPWGRESSKEE